MSTRAVYTFKDQYNKFAAYKHHDGYPSGAFEWIKAGVDKASGTYTASELAISFVVANKGNGGAELTKGQQAHGDLDYDYVISTKKGKVWIEAFEHSWATISGDDYTKNRNKFFSGTLEAFEAEYSEKATQAA